MMRIATVIGLLAAGAAVAAGVAVGGAPLACEPERGTGTLIRVDTGESGSTPSAVEEFPWSAGEADL
jgi:hypothetical protein